MGNKLPPMELFLFLVKVDLHIQSDKLILNGLFTSLLVAIISDNGEGTNL